MLPKDLTCCCNPGGSSGQGAKARRRGRAKRLQSLPDMFVRVPLQWLVKPCRPHLFEPKTRLFLYVLYKSHWGPRGVRLTDAFALEIGMPGRTKREAITRLERDGWVRVERTDFLAPVVWPIAIAG